MVNLKEIVPYIFFTFPVLNPQNHRKFDYSLIVNSLLDEFSPRGDWKQWKWKPETKNGKIQILIHVHIY